MKSITPEQIADVATSDFRSNDDYAVTIIALAWEQGLAFRKDATCERGVLVFAWPEEVNAESWQTYRAATLAFIAELIDCEAQFGVDVPDSEISVTF